MDGPGADAAVARSRSLQGPRSQRRPSARKQLPHCGAAAIRQQRVVTTGEYREIAPNKRLVKIWVLEGQSPGVDRYPTLLTVDFRELGPSTTEMTLRQDQLRTFIDRAGNRMGWKMCFKKLDVLLKTSAPRS